LEVKGNRTASANIEVANNLVQNYGNIGIFIQRSDDVTIKGNTLTPFLGASAFNSIVFSSKEGTSGVQAAVRLENLSITGNTFNGAGSNLGTGIAFWNHNGSASVIPLINAKIGGSDADKNTFSSDLASYISLDATPSGGNTENALMGTLYDITQVGFPDRITNIFPFNGEVDASYNVFGAVNTGTETDFAKLLAIKAKIADGMDNTLTSYVDIQPKKAFIGLSTDFSNALTVLKDGYTIIFDNDDAIYHNLGDRTIEKSFTFDIYNNANAEIIFGNLTLNALNKEVTFDQPAKANGDFLLTEGKINASQGFGLDADKVITFNFAKPNNFINGKVKLTNVKLGNEPKLLVGSGTIATGVSFSGVTGNSNSSFEVEYFPTAYSNTTSFNAAELGLIHTREYWSVTRIGTTEGKLEFKTFDFATSGFTSFDAADATIARYNGTAWVNAGNSANSVSSNVGAITSNANSDFGVFTYAKMPIPVLPIKLIAFTAQATTGGALVKWSTSEEKNNAKFEIEKSFDGKNFFVIDTKTGKPNSATVANYEFLDLSFKQSAYYRLVQVDADGKKTTYADLAKFVKGLDNSLSVIAYPNPVTTKLYVTVGAANKENVKLLLTDLTGKTLKLKLGDSVQPIELDVADVTRGTYILQVIKDSGNVSKKILKL
ncbi:MAG: T9SS type A sorting domain-containing protein, partial [Flavobacterium sp.]